MMVKKKIKIFGIEGENMGTSLIPIKGISQALKKSLKSNCNITDIESLLENGRTPEQRRDIADKLGIDRRFVDIWVKQAAIWNVEGMTEDFAYLLIVAGIRCALDLAKIDIDATKNAVKAASNAHPDYQYDESKLYVLKAAAECLSMNSNITMPVFDENDPEPRHLFVRSGFDISGAQSSSSNIAKITVTVTFANGQSYENTTTFPVLQGSGGNTVISTESSSSTGTSGTGERPSGRVDHPAGKGSYSNTIERTGEHSSARPSSSKSSSSKPSGRVDHPGMTGGSSNKGSSSSKNGSSNKASGSTGRRR